MNAFCILLFFVFCLFLGARLLLAIWSGDGGYSADGRVVDDSDLMTGDDERGLGAEGVRRWRRRQWQWRWYSCLVIFLLLRLACRYTVCY